MQCRSQLSFIDDRHNYRVEFAHEIENGSNSLERDYCAGNKKIQSPLHPMNLPIRNPQREMRCA